MMYSYYYFCFILSVRLRKQLTPSCKYFQQTNLSNSWTKQLFNVTFKSLENMTFSPNNSGDCNKCLAFILLLYFSQAGAEMAFQN